MCLVRKVPHAGAARSGGSAWIAWRHHPHFSRGRRIARVFSAGEHRLAYGYAMVFIGAAQRFAIGSMDRGDAHFIFGAKRHSTLATELLECRDRLSRFVEIGHAAVY